MLPDAQTTSTVDTFGGEEILYVLNEHSAHLNAAV